VIEVGWLLVRLTALYFAPLQGGGSLGSLTAEFAVVLFGRFDLALERSAAIRCEFFDRLTSICGEKAP
jgi:hypothetical protein